MVNKKEIEEFKKLKKFLKKDFDEIIFLLIILFLGGYLILKSKLVLAVVTLIITMLVLIIYRTYFKKKEKITIKNKRYYEFLGKLLYLSILLSFFGTYSLKLFRIINIDKDMSVALFYPRLILLIAIVFLLLWSFYLLRRWVMNRGLFFCVVSLIAIYETLILFFVNNRYGVKPSDSDIGFYLFSLFIVGMCLWLIWISANVNKFKK